MKYIKILLLVAPILWLDWSCQDVTVGFLTTEEVNYKPDSMVVKRVLDDDPGIPNPRYQEYLDEGYTPEQIENWFGIPERLNSGEDYNRSRWQYPWVSVPVEGVHGTPQISVSIKEVKTETGDVAKMKEYLKVRNNGIFEIPLEHDIPVGRYVISLNFRNEGRSQNVNDCFTIIVK